MTELQRLLYRELYKKSFYEFVKAFWSTCEPAKMVDGKLIQIYCEIFQYMCKDWVGYKEIEIELPEKTDDIEILDIRQNKHNLCLMVPPRHTKSLIFNVFGPVWLWLSHPIKAVSISHTGALANQMNSKRYMVINSLKFKELFNDIILQTNTSSFLKDSRGGELYSLNRNAFTGYGGDVIINDDLTNAETARKDQQEMNNAWEYYKNTMPSRINDINKCIIMNIQQRLAVNDIAGHIMEEPKLAATYAFITLPAIFEKETYVVCPISGEVIKFQKGDYLWPERFDNYETLRAQVGESVFETQYLQHPLASDKTIIKPEMIIEKSINDVPDIQYADMIYSSNDFPVKDKEESDYLGSILAYRIENNLYILDCLEKHMAFVKGVEYVKKLDELYPGIIQIIEDKANGSATIQLLQDTLAGIQAFNPGVQSKIQRLESASYYINNVIFVKDKYNEDTKSYVLSDNLENLKKRLLQFPFVEHDDVCDAFSMLLLFVFLDKRYMVYGRSFNDMNIVESTTLDKTYSTTFFNKEGDVWKICEIVVQYGIETKLIVAKEKRIKCSIEEGINELKLFAPTHSTFIDCSATPALQGMYEKNISILRYEIEDFDKSVAKLNLAFDKKLVLLDKDCKLTKGDIETFKFTKNKDDTVKYITEKDGFVGCLRVAIKYYGI